MACRSHVGRPAMRQQFLDPAGRLRCPPICVGGRHPGCIRATVQGGLAGRIRPKCWAARKGDANWRPFLSECAEGCPAEPEVGESRQVTWYGTIRAFRHATIRAAGPLHALTSAQADAACSLRRRRVQRSHAGRWTAWHTAISIRARVLEIAVATPAQVADDESCRRVRTGFDDGDARSASQAPPCHARCTLCSTGADGMQRSLVSPFASCKGGLALMLCSFHAGHGTARRRS